MHSIVSLLFNGTISHVGSINFKSSFSAYVHQGDPGNDNRTQPHPAKLKRTLYMLSSLYMCVKLNCYITHSCLCGKH